jgi:transposase-like protein
MSKRKAAIAVAAILLVSGTVVWAVMRKGNRTDPKADAQIGAVKQLQAELFKPGITPQQRGTVWERVRKEMGQLSDEQRQEIRQQMRDNMERRIDSTVAAYFALPKDQRVAYLDKQIKQWDQVQKQMGAWRAQAGQSGQSGGPAAGPGGPPSNDANARATSRNQRLDNVTPEQRAQRNVFISDFVSRRAQLGLPPLPMRGPASR